MNSFGVKIVMLGIKVGKNRLHKRNNAIRMNHRSFAKSTKILSVFWLFFLFSWASHRLFSNLFRLSCLSPVSFLLKGWLKVYTLMSPVRQSKENDRDSRQLGVSKRSPGYKLPSGLIEIAKYGQIWEENLLSLARNWKISFLLSGNSFHECSSAWEWDEQNTLSIKIKSAEID